MLFNKGLLLAAVESAFGTAETLTASDALEVIDPQFNPDFTKLTRNTMTGFKSPNAFSIGRKLGAIQFQVEAKGPGFINARGKLGRLLLACDMTETVHADSSALIFSKPIPMGTPSNTFTMVQTDAYTGKAVRRILLTCTTGGGSGTCKFDVDSPASGSDAAVHLTGAGALAMTSGTEFLPLGASGGSITPTFTGTFTVGDQFVIYFTPPGYRYSPRTAADAEGGHSLTMTIHYDGISHTLTGARGTWSLQAGAGEFGVFSFNFVGNYNPAEDASIPSNPVFETTMPPQVEKARLWLPKENGLLDTAVCAAQFGFSMSNSVVPRRCVNGANGYAGAKITTRSPQFSADPEMLLEADHGFWGLFEEGAKYDVSALIAEFDSSGDHVPGNAVAFVAPVAQTSAMPYGNRDNTRVANLTAELSKFVGDDELSVLLI